MQTAASSTKAVFIARACALLALVVAGTVLLGWHFEIERLKTLADGLAAMNPATAVTFALAGATLLGLTLPGRQTASAVNTLSAIVFIVGMVKLGSV
ncbi:hypothetical protein EON80_22155, partial [bacterium]